MSPCFGVIDVKYEAYTVIARKVYSWCSVNVGFAVDKLQQLRYTSHSD